MTLAYCQPSYNANFLAKEIEENRKASPKGQLASSKFSMTLGNIKILEGGKRT